MLSETKPARGCAGCAAIWFFLRRLNGADREREQTLEEARTARKGVFNFAQLLARCTGLASIEAVVARDTAKRADEFTVSPKLEAGTSVISGSIRQIGSSHMAFPVNAAIFSGMP